MIHNGLEDPTRRNFFCTVTAAAAKLTSIDQFLFAATAGSQSTEAGAPALFQLVRAQTFQDYIEALHEKPGNTNLVDSKMLPFTAVLTVEVGYSEKEFEWHEDHDHLFQMIDGTTVYEIGGTPKNSHSPRPGEWRSSDSEGSIAVTLGKGDMLLIPRGTPHRQKTLKRATFMLISPRGEVKT